MKRLGIVIAVGSLVSVAWASTSHAHDVPCPSSDRSQSDEAARRSEAGATGTTRTTQATYDPTAARATYAPAAEREKARWYAHPHRGLLITGSSMFLSSYATLATVGALSPLDVDHRFYIPVAGPWMNLAERPCGLGACGGREDLTNALILGGGVTQAVGLGLALLSFVVPERRERVTAAPATKVHVAPLSFGRGAGLGAVGTF